MWVSWTLLFGVFSSSIQEANLTESVSLFMLQLCRDINLKVQAQGWCQRIKANDFEEEAFDSRCWSVKEIKCDREDPCRMQWATLSVLCVGVLHSCMSSGTRSLYVDWFNAPSCFILICAPFYWSFCSVITRGGELSELVHSKSVQIRKSAKFPKCEKVIVVSHHLCIRLLQSAFTFNKTQAICSSWSTQEDSGVCLLSCIAVSR